MKAAISLPDPTKYKCRLPVAQDGTCNGLQHYAALGGDAVGARQVNLEPSDKPQDVYSGVAELVKQKLVDDAQFPAVGTEDEPQAELSETTIMARRLLPLITRKVVKQTVMTNVYGVTFIGAKAQIHNQLKDLPAMHAFEVSVISKHALYLTRKVFECVRSMFTGAHHIQDWLGKSAWRISRSISPSQMEKYAAEEAANQAGGGVGRGKSKLSRLARDKKLFYMTSVVWTTPLGLPVVQPYRQRATQLIPTYLQNIFISDPNIIDEVNSRKQMTAFPPNYIHSLDATHMLLSAIECNKEGLDFAAVHDSFWTHPSDVDKLNRILRDCFINLHTSDLIGKLYEEFTRRYAGFKYLASFPETSRVGARIRTFRMKQAATRKRAMNASEELIMEMERDRLLRSEDPQEQERGRNMVTAASIAEAATEADLGAGSATSGDEAELSEILGDTEIEDIDEMSEKQTAASAPQVVMLGSEEEVPDALSGVAAMNEGLMDSIDEDEADSTLLNVSTPEMEEEKSVVKRGRPKASDTTESQNVSSDQPKKRTRKKRSKSGALRTGMKVNVWMSLSFPQVPDKVRRSALLVIRISTNAIYCRVTLTFPGWNRVLISFLDESRPHHCYNTLLTFINSSKIRCILGSGVVISSHLFLLESFLSISYHLLFVVLG